MARSYRKQINNHVITWSNREGRYIIKKGKKRIYTTEYLMDAKGWINRNT